MFSHYRKHRNDTLQFSYPLFQACKEQELYIDMEEQGRSLEAEYTKEGRTANMKFR